jgi:hypothetical protein
MEFIDIPSLAKLIKDESPETAGGASSVVASRAARLSRAFPDDIEPF